MLCSPALVCLVSSVYSLDQDPENRQAFRKYVLGWGQWDILPYAMRSPDHLENMSTREPGTGSCLDRKVGGSQCARSSPFTNELSCEVHLIPSRLPSGMSVPSQSRHHDQVTAKKAWCWSRPLSFMLDAWCGVTRWGSAISPYFGIWGRDWLFGKALRV